MRAVIIDDGRLGWGVRPDPEPVGTELLVEVHAAGINAADLLQRRGRYPAPAGSPPDIPGLELAGTVVAKGSRVTRFSTGDRVMAIVGSGAQAELALLDEATAIAVPSSIDFAAAGGFPEAFFTAFDALFAQCRLQVGERVLITGAAGGVGSAAIQLACSAGARVVASSRHPGLHPDLVGLAGAASNPDTAAAMIAALEPVEALDRGPFDVVLELVGGPGLADAINALATGGRIAVIGVGAGARVELDMLALMRSRGHLHGSTLRARSSSEKADLARAVTAQVVPLLAEGRIRVPVAATFPMSDAEAGYELFARGGKLGKIILLSS